MKIIVFGLGYVGCVSAASFANENHKVIGVDINADKVDIINSGKSPIVEPGLEELMNKVVKNGNLSASVNYEAALSEADLALVCVGTPSHKNGSVNLDYIFRVAEQFGNVIAKSDKYTVFVIRSTVPPGTLKKCVDIITNVSGKRPDKDFGACSNPEFLREGTALKDFYEPPFTVIGEWDKKSGDYLEEIYKNVNAPLIRSEVGVAEIMKYANNVFHALKVAFGNEIGTVCKAYGIDSHKVMEIFCMDDKLNLSSYYLKPGFAFGGSCLPKDVRGLVYQGKQHDLDLPLINSIMPSNESHIRRAVDLVLAQGKKNVGVLGLSFKGDTDDLRESPMVAVVETLIGKGYTLKIYDKNVNFAKLFGANREYINEKIPHISNLMVDSIDNLVDHSELIIIGNNSKEFQDFLNSQNNSITVLDFVRIFESLEGNRTAYDGICW
jgi:GDP-mannose 6-dehydrogenase